MADFEYTDSTLSFLQSCSRAMAILNDRSLLQLFVSGDASLEANTNLRVEPLNHLRQLFTTRGMLLATADDQALPPYVHLRAATKYIDALHETLLGHDFVPINLAENNKIVRYEYHPAPNEYRHAWGVANHLWRKWWKRPERSRNHQSDDTGFMVLHGGDWHTIQEIVLNRSALYITSSQGESVLQGNDQTIWLERYEEAEAAVFPSAHNSARRSSQMTDVVSPQPAQLTTKGSSTKPICPTLVPVVRHSEGKYYIKTAIGEVVVAGGMLHCGVCKKNCEQRPVTRQPGPRAKPSKATPMKSNSR
ncbi:MAG: hypothetical protein F6K00_08145 [Leptolyngbya sp. SIOISBB]|nr:hypothetical protein [Leptolyngbya sp. SIOISBB]